MAFGVSAIMIVLVVTWNLLLQAVAQEVDQYTKAFQVFKEKYQYLAGDMPTAESFWGSDTNCPNTPYTPTPHIAACNGDGDDQSFTTS